MAHSVAYTSGHSRGDAIDLYSRDAWIGALGELRRVSWDYELSNRDVMGANAPAVERSAQLTCTKPALLDAMRDAFDADIRAHTPGTLTVNGEWSQSCYVVASEPADDVSPSMVRTKLTFVLLDGMWRHELPVVSCTISHGTDGGDLDLPTDMPFDLSSPRISSSVDNPCGYAIPWRMVIYGPVSNPRVSIGGNDIMVDTMVPDGGYLTIDVLQRTVTLTAANGDQTNAFASAHRGSGQGSGEYVFEPLPAGSSVIEWDGSFGFDLTPIEERSSPSWLTLS